MQPTYKLTVAVPVYNTARYLKETLICIENQSFGIENMEVILVNDGSTDSSAEICRDFQRNHMENVRYVEFAKNQGVSHVKNTALDMAKGTYITFWDSDDLWSLNAMEEAVAFLDAHETEIDMVSCNINYFDSYSHSHILNFAVTENMIIDIQKAHQRIRTSGAACVMQLNAAKKCRFDESQTRWEDAKHINQILLQKKKYGMLAEVQFYYRRRRENDSATQTHGEDKQYYLYDLKAFFQGVYKESLKQCGTFIPMMQYLMAYTLGYFFAETVSILNEKEHRQYDAVCKKILSVIDDCHIKEISNANSYVRAAMLSVKHDLGMEPEINQWQQKEQESQWNWMRMARTKANYDVLKQWFLLKKKNKTVLSYFEKNGYARIAVYGLSDLGKYLVEELAESSVKVVYGIDRRAKKMTAEFPIFTIEDMFPEVDVIIVTAVYFFDEIDIQLRNKLNCPIVSLEDVLYTIE